MADVKKPNRGWRRSHVSSVAEQVALELSGRELSDLEVCRQVWEDELDPLALCVAVTQSGLATWLEAALLMMLTENMPGVYRPLKRELWQRRNRHSKQATYAYLVAAERANSEQDERPLRWEDARETCIRTTAGRYDDMPVVGPEVVQKAFTEVRAALARYPSRFYVAPGVISERLDQVWKHAVTSVGAPVKRADRARKMKVRKRL